MNTPNKYIRRIAQEYNILYGHKPIIEGHYVKVDEARADAIAVAYEALPRVDETFHTRMCYWMLGKEVQRQWEHAIQHGYTFEPWQQDGQPYANSTEMCQDLAQNKHLWFFTGGEVHPYLGETDAQGLSYNDKFRAVHDFFGHASKGYQFGDRGELNAWIHHSMMFSFYAQLALTTETQGQTCWVNHGPYRHIPACDRPYAEQKCALLPVEYCNWQQFLQS